MNLFQGQFVPFHYASLLCIVLHKKSMPTYEEEDILCFFFFNQLEKLSSPSKRIWWHTIYISSLQSSEKL